MTIPDDAISEEEPKRRFRGTKPRPSFECSCGDHVWAAITRGFVVFVSPEDRAILDARSWTAHVSKRTVYAKAATYGKDIAMHRLLMPDAQEVDHINHNGSDNRRSNIRACSHAENKWNARSRKGSQSKYLGASIDRRGKWIAHITTHGKTRWLGTFETDEDAGAAYIEAAKQYRGEFVPESGK